MAAVNSNLGAQTIPTDPQILRVGDWVQVSQSLCIVNVQSISRASILSKCPLDHDLKIRSRRLPSDYGRLGVWPVEVFLMILDHVTIRTMVDIRRLSSRARKIVDSCFLYRTLLSSQNEGPMALRAMLATEAGSHYTASDLINALDTDNCQSRDCNYSQPDSVYSPPGIFLDVLFCERLCVTCWLLRSIVTLMVAPAATLVGVCLIPPDRILAGPPHPLMPISEKLTENGYTLTVDGTALRINYMENVYRVLQLELPLICFPSLGTAAHAIFGNLTYSLGPANDMTIASTSDDMGDPFLGESYLSMYRQAWIIILQRRSNSRSRVWGFACRACHATQLAEIEFPIEHPRDSPLNTAWSYLNHFRICTSSQALRNRFTQLVATYWKNFEYGIFDNTNKREQELWNWRMTVNVLHYWRTGKFSRPKGASDTEDRMGSGEH